MAEDRLVNVVSWSEDDNIILEANREGIWGIRITVPYTTKVSNRTYAEDICKFLRAGDPSWTSEENEKSANIITEMLDQYSRER